MSDRRRKKTAEGAALAVCAALILTGCSRSQMNYQIAEAIGTDGLYEDNAPVETPEMKQRREAQEQSESEEKSLTDVLAGAQALAAGYDYEGALALLDTLTGTQAMDERVASARQEYQDAQDSFAAWEGDIPHLCFPTLIEDPEMAFDGDDRSDSYSSAMTTAGEFSAILESLYENNYILIDIHSIAALTPDEAGAMTMKEEDLYLPEGKKPIVLSQDNVDYASVKNGDGIATKLVLDENGAVKAQYTDDGGHDLTGDYDLIPILDSFVAQHPDFSFRGARGIVSVSGSNGVFGYSLDDQDDRDTIASICSALTGEGWSIACAGWSHSYMGEKSMTESAFAAEIENWTSQVEPLTGTSDIIFFPYGDEVSRPGQDLTVLLDSGFVYQCGLWGDTDYREIADGYMRMTRRFVDGYSLMNNPGYFTEFFNVDDILDPGR